MLKCPMCQMLKKNFYFNQENSPTAGTFLLPTCPQTLKWHSALTGSKKWSSVFTWCHETPLLLLFSVCVWWVTPTSLNKKILDVLESHHSVSEPSMMKFPHLMSLTQLSRWWTHWSHGAFILWKWSEEQKRKPVEKFGQFETNNQLLVCLRKKPRVNPSQSESAGTLHPQQSLLRVENSPRVRSWVPCRPVALSSKPIGFS